MKYIVKSWYYHVDHIIRLHVHSTKHYNKLVYSTGFRSWTKYTTSWPTNDLLGLSLRCSKPEYFGCHRKFFFLARFKIFVYIAYWVIFKNINRISCSIKILCILLGTYVLLFDKMRFLDLQSTYLNQANEFTSFAFFQKWLSN